MAYGLPVEGEDGPFIGSRARAMPTIRWDASAAEARAQIGALGGHEGHEGHGHEGHDHGHEGHDHGHEGHDHGHEGHEGHDHGHEGHDHPAGGHDRGIETAEIAAIVVGPGDLAIGALRADDLMDAEDGSPVLDLISPVPPTVRPSVTVASLEKSEDPQAVVTTSDGRLVGKVNLGEEDGGPEEDLSPEESDEFDKILAEVQERFGSEDPSPEELRSFLHERLVAEGRTPEEADQFLSEMEAPDTD